MCMWIKLHLQNIQTHFWKGKQREMFVDFFFLNALHRGNKKITYVLCVTIIISSYVIQHRNPARILAQQINQRSLRSRWAKERSSNPKTVASSGIPLWLHLQSGTQLPVWGWWECPTSFWSHTKIKVKRFMSFSFLASRKEIQVCELGTSPVSFTVPWRGQKLQKTPHICDTSLHLLLEEDQGRYSGNTLSWLLESLDTNQFLPDSADITGIWGPPNSFQKRYF